MANWIILIRIVQELFILAHYVIRLCRDIPDVLVPLWERLFGVAGLGVVLLHAYSLLPI